MSETPSAELNEPTTWPTGAPSPPTVRVIEILERLASSPERAFGATELARLLGLNKSTCLSILSTLTDAGYLIQHPKRRDYRLGPGLITLSRSARAVLPDLSDVRPILRAAAHDVDTVINVTGILEGQIVILDVAGTADAFGGVLRVGVRVPLMPPYGAVHVAWADRSRWDEWLLESPVPLTPRIEAELLEAMSIARGRGFLATVDLPDGHPMVPVQNGMRGLARRLDSDDFRELARVRLEAGVYLLGEVDAANDHVIGQVQVPILGWGEPSLALAANFTGRRTSGRRIVEIADRLRAAAAAIAASTPAG